MSTPKKNTKKPAADIETSGEPQVVGHRAFACDKDGSVREATPEEMASAKGALITVASKTDGGAEIVATFDCNIQLYENGNIGLFIRTSDTLDDVEIDNPKPKDLGDGVGENRKMARMASATSAIMAFVHFFTEVPSRYCSR